MSPSRYWPVSAPQRPPKRPRACVSQRTSCIRQLLTPEAASKDKKKKKKTGKEGAEDGIRLKKSRRGADMYDTDEEV